MKIVHKLKTSLIGGTETHALALGLAQREAGYDVSMVISGPRGPVSDIMEAKGLPVYYAEGKSENDIFGALRVRKILKQLKADVIHSHGMERVALISMGHLKTVRVTTAHCYPSISIQGVLLRKSMSFIDRWMCKIIDGYIAVTEDVHQGYAKRKYFVHRPWKVIYNGIDLSKFHATPGITLPSKESGQPIELLWVGRMEPDKCPVDSIRILSLLRNKHGLDVRLTLCGDGNLMPQCKELTKELGMSEFVDLSGRRNDVDLLMRKSHGVLFLSEYEPFGQVPIEAMASGCPVFSYDIAGGFREWFKPEGYGGVIAEERTPESLAAKTTAVLSDRNLWEQLRQDAIKTANESFSSTVMAEKTVAFYQELLS